MASFDWRRALSIARKETRHVWRDPVSLAVALALPVFMVTFFGFAIDFDVRNVDILVADGDHTRLSRELIDLFSSSGYFKVRHAHSSADAASALAADRAKAALIINPNFQKDLRAGRPVSAQVLLDGADNENAGIVATYLVGIQAAAERRLVHLPRPRAQLVPRFLFNPELNSHWFIIPGLFVIVVGLLSTLLTALTIAREWENGSMEMLLSTPVQPLEIIAGKLVPYLVLSFMGVVLIFMMARFVFDVPFIGNPFIFLSATILFLVASMSQGLVISVVTRQQLLAFQTVMQTGLMPIQLLSGFIFPIISMPLFFQVLTMILPARWYMTLARALFLKAPDLKMALGPLAGLAALSILSVLLAWKQFKTDMEP